MELDAVQPPAGIGQARERGGVGLRGGLEPLGRRVIESPWLIHTGWSRSTPPNSPSSSSRVIRTFAGPYSLRSAGRTSPPSSWAMSCAP
jgi:hypothetical protein